MSTPHQFIAYPIGGNRITRKVAAAIAAVTIILGTVGYVYAVTPNPQQQKWIQDGVYNEQLVRLEADAAALRGERALYAALYDTASKWPNSANGRAEAAAFKIRVDSYDSRVASLSDQWQAVNTERTGLEMQLTKSQGSFLPAE